MTSAIKNTLVSVVLSALVGALGFTVAEIKEQGEKAARLEEAANHFKQGYIALLTHSEKQAEALYTARSDVEVLKSKVNRNEKTIEILQKTIEILQGRIVK